MNLVKFRYGSPVTENSPALLPGAFTFDSDSLALYIDLDDARVQIQDPLKLSLTGGQLTGSVEVVDNLGTTMSSFGVDGVVQGQFLETTGNIALDTAPTLYAVLDANGRIRTRTKAEMILDLRILDPDSLGDLAYKDSASGSYTPVGTVSTPTVTVNYDTESVVKSVTPGDLPTYEVTGELLELGQGSQLSTASTDVMKTITSVEVSQPEFTGTPGTVNVN